ncbi:RHS repeat-associated core domain-containing protein [Streptomyces justiciae]|uniref:RHS repeat-associated core domain-containing protein n=1 Tax=Streptomyces justiciae TaxID=2780140 RepID=A0ABU3M6Y9_9ACTN|nr:RHS repeat-associated core domain-containing protein [Streptomyces justiciae]MDT7846806.1 RHS repeat-associated core domain-containing protein [Streptomyces justiciae]
MAGHRPTDWHVLDLDKDPTPGDPDRIKLLAKTLHDFADDVSDALRLVNGMAGEDTLLEWAGKSAEVFKDEFGDVPKNLKKLKKSYELCGDALTDFWPKLERAQALADRALAKGREAQSDLSSANSRLASADSWVTRANKEADKYKDDPTGSKSGGDKPDEGKVRAATRDAQHAKSAQTSAQSDVHDAQGALAAAKKMAEDARKMREEAAHTAKTKIDEASDAGIQNRSWWEEVGDWFSDNWDNIVAVCKVVVAVVGVIAMIIGGPILGAIVLIAALVVLADTLYKYSKGQAGLLDVAFAAMDCIPGGKGITSLGKLAKGMKSLAKGGLKGMAGGLLKRGLRKEADNALEKSKPFGSRCKNGEPIDMISGEYLMTEADVELPGLLPLVLRRTHVSTYRSGQWFGPSWASTLDERLELDDEGVLFAAEDGMVLVYPVPTPGSPVLPENGPRWPLEWDGTRNGPLRISDPKSGRTRYFTPATKAAGPDGAYSLPLTGMSDRAGHRIDFDRAPDGAPLAVRHSGGYHLSVDTDGDTRRVTALRLRTEDREAEGTVVRRFGYDANGNLAEIYNSSDLPFRIVYDDRSRIVSWTDRNNSWYRLHYDDADRCVRGEGAGGYLDCTVTYDTASRSTVYTDALGNSTRYRYNELLQLTAETNPLGATVRYAWDRHNRPLSVTDPLDRTTSYTYDEFGNVIGTVRRDGVRVRASYNALHQPVTVTDASGAEWRHSYDERGNLLQTTDPGGRITRYEYDMRGHLTAVTDALGGVHRLETNAAGLPVRLTDPLGNSTCYRHDAFGRVVRINDAAGDETLLSWSVEGNLVQRLLPQGDAEKCEFDGEGNLTAHIDGSGRRTRYEITHFDLVSARIDPDGTRHEYTYDGELRLLQVRNPAQLLWTYAYNAAGQLVGERDFNGRVVSYQRDAAGQLITRTNGAGQSVHYTRDLMGNAVQHRAVDGDAVEVSTFTYDATGRLTGAGNPHTTLVYRYDELGRLLSETCNDRTISFAYDVLGRRTERRTPNGIASRIDYDAIGRHTSLVSDGHRLTFGHDGLHRETERVLDSGVRLTRSWGPGRQLAAQTVTAPGGDGTHELVRRSYSYDRSGDLAETNDLRRGRQPVELDELGRVLSVGDSSGSERYSYDASGNMAGQDREFTGTLIRRAGRSSYDYDDQGRVVRHVRRMLSGGRRVWEFAWDPHDRLIGVVTPDGTRWRYLYDPTGRRIAKQRLAADGMGVDEEVTFAWDGTVIAEQVHTGDGGERHITTWDWSPDSYEPLAQTERVTGPQDAPQEEIDRRFYSIVTDLVGAPTELIDEQGEIAWAPRRTVWGRASETAPGEPHCPLRFPGQYHDAETGLHYNLFRYYDPETARYQSPDPLGLAAAPNQYGYVRNPFFWIDPLGLAPGCGDEVLDPSQNTVHGHVADVTIHAPDGSVRMQYGLWSGRMTPQEAALGRGYNAQAVTHTEHRISRLSGASTGPRINIPNDPYHGQIPLQPGEHAVIDAVLPPCSRCRGAMNRMHRELGVDVTYNWDGPEGAGTWQAGRRR